MIQTPTSKEQKTTSDLGGAGSQPGSIVIFQGQISFVQCSTHTFCGSRMFQSRHGYMVHRVVPLR
jgi:hypothetical protein